MTNESYLFDCGLFLFLFIGCLLGFFRGFFIYFLLLLGWVIFYFLGDFCGFLGLFASIFCVGVLLLFFGRFIQNIASRRNKTEILTSLKSFT